MHTDLTLPDAHCRCQRAAWVGSFYLYISVRNNYNCVVGRTREYSLQYIDYVEHNWVVVRMRGCCLECSKAVSLRLYGSSALVEPQRDLYCSS
jgi:hypothetical protein